MKRPSRVEEREQRITMEIVVDAYTPEEQAMGWYYSLEDRLHFPFVARCTPSALSRRCASVTRSTSSG
jgi:Calcium binding